MQPEDLTPTHVLVVESPPEVAEELRYGLNQLGLDVAVATTGAQALNMVPLQRFSTAVVATPLPDMSGSACIRELQMRDRDLPCIALANTPTLENVVEIANLSVFGFLIRPVPQDQLLEVVSRAVEHRRLQDELETERLRTAQLLGILQTIDTIQDRINNPLQSLLGFAELLEEETDPNTGDTAMFVERVTDAARSIADVVDLLRRVRRPVTKKWSFGETLDLEAAVVPQSDRRLTPRAISVMLARLPTTTGRLWYFVEDVSQGGMAIHVRQPSVLPAEMDVELADPETGDTYLCRACVVWTDPSQQRAGLRFTVVDPRLAERLRPGTANGETGQ